MTRLLRTPGCSIYLAAYLAALLAGCAYVPRSGDSLILRRDAVVQATPGADAEPAEPAETFRGKPGLVFPTGATVEVVGQYDGKGRPTGPEAPAGAGTQWVRVKVTASPVPTQVGKDGWVHVRAVGKDGDTRSNLEGLTARTRQEATLCADTTAAQGSCSQRIPAGTPVRPLTCVGGAVKLEYWDAQGLYASGYVPMTQVDGNPCQSMAGAWGGFGSAVAGGGANYEANFPISPEFSHSAEELDTFVH